MLHEKGHLDTSVIRGDGTTTAAKEGGDNLEFSGHKHMKGDNVVAFCDGQRPTFGHRNCNIISPFVTAPGNRNESPLLKTALSQVMSTARTIGIDLARAIASLDGAYDSHDNRKAIFNRSWVPNITENLRGSKTPKRDPKRLFDSSIFQERFNTIERVLAWEDKFKRLLLRFERISKLHYALRGLACKMINLRHCCQGLVSI